MSIKELFGVFSYSLCILVWTINIIEAYRQRILWIMFLSMAVVAIAFTLLLKVILGINN